MRSSINTLLSVPPGSNNWTSFSKNFKFGHLEKAIEEHLRTYMLNGTTPEELSEKAYKHLESI